MWNNFLWHFFSFLKLNFRFRIIGKHHMALSDFWKIFSLCLSVSNWHFSQAMYLNSIILCLSFPYLCHFNLLFLSFVLCFSICFIVPFLSFSIFFSFVWKTATVLSAILHLAKIRNESFNWNCRFCFCFSFSFFF